MERKNKLMRFISECKFNYIDDTSLNFFNGLNDIDPVALDYKNTSNDYVSGVYFLLNNEDKIVYIGKSTDVFFRLRIHEKKATIPFCSYKVFVIESSLLDVAERFFINKYLPEFNRDCLTDKIRKIKSTEV